MAKTDEPADDADDLLRGITIAPRNKHGIITVRSTDKGDFEMYPFKIADEEALLALYRPALKLVRFDFAPVKCGEETVAFSPEDQHRIRRKVALHWMYFYSLNNMPVKVKVGDLKHPQTYDIIRRVAEQRFGAGTPAAIAVSAGAVGMTPAGFAGWMERDKQIGDAF